MPARITPLFAVGDRVAVRAPQLTDGAKLIVEGNERLFPTQPIKIVNEQPAGAPAREASAITQSN